MPTNAVLAVKFDEPVNEQALSGIQLRQNGVPVVVDRLVSADHETVTLKLKQLLAPNATYAFVVEGVQDLSGNALNPGRTVLFTTGPGIDLFEPVQTLRTPVNGATNVPLNPVIEAQFNERISPVSVSGTVRLYDTATNQSIVSTLNTLAHQEDPTRLTAAASNQLPAAQVNWLTDVTGFNEYYGWYQGTYNDIGPWLDAAHADNPGRSIGLSEFGAGAALTAS